MADNEKDKVLKPKKQKVERQHFRKFKETISELKKVSWPSFGTVAKSTGIVFALVGIFFAVLLIFDLILTYFVFNPLTGEGFPWGGGAAESFIGNISTFAANAACLIKDAFASFSNTFLQF